MSLSAPVYAYMGMGLPLRHYPQFQPEVTARYPMGAHPNCCGSNSDMLYVREVAMMIVMEMLTDKKDWHKKVFDDEIVARWRKEALEMPDELLRTQITAGKYARTGFGGDERMAGLSDKLTGIMSEKAFDWCVEELRAKARYFEKTGIVPTLDRTGSVAKSDTLVSAELREELRAAFERLKHDQAPSPDWHPGTGEKVQNLVHPSMYPLVYGQTRVLRREAVGVTDAIDRWAGKGDVLPKAEDVPDSTQYLSGFAYGYGYGGSDIPPEFWSNTYQWLPSNVAFRDDGSVEFTSYINNLHPQKYQTIYRTLEKLIATAMPLWEQCLVEYRYGGPRGDGSPGKQPGRINMHDEEWDPPTAEAAAGIEVDPSALESDEYDWDDEETRTWMLVRKPVQPEPGDPKLAAARSYEVRSEDRLAAKFRDSGLQVIVKIASIELTPEKPKFPVGGWHVEGQMNEQICATALYYLDSENITPSSLAFRMMTSYDQDDIEYGQDQFDWHEQVYGTLLRDGPCLQNYGSVETKEGRLLAFPNTFQHRVSPFELKDPTKPGHRRFIALWLVDPHVRIISTANVPPQQRSWWVESVLGASSEARKEAAAAIPPEVLRLLREKEGTADGGGGGGGAEEHEEGVDGGGAPASATAPATTSLAAAQAMIGRKTPRLPEELVGMIRQHVVDEGLMGEAEALQHRLDLMAERTRFDKKAQSHWVSQTYSFCEH